jgi:hypothetical protein
MVLTLLTQKNSSCSQYRGAGFSVTWSLEYFFVRIMDWIQHSITILLLTYMSNTDTSYGC